MTAEPTDRHGSPERAGADDGGPPMRVAQLITTLARGGAQATVVASSGPIAAGVEVEILSGPDDTGEGTFRGDPALEGVTVRTVPDLRRPLRPVSDLRALIWLVRHLRAERPDVLHTHSSKAGVVGRLAAAIARVPCVHTVHGWGPVHAASGPVRLAVVALERFLARLSAALVVVGRADLESGMTRRIGRPERYHLIRSGVELPPPDLDRTPLRREVRAELGLGDRFTVGMVGRMARQKDQATLIEAFATAALPTDAVLVLVGDGPERDRVAGLAAARPDLDIRLLGARADGARVVAGFDVAVNASRWEGLPRTVVEAAGVGVPVVASDVGGTRELIRPGRTGRLVPAEDATALARALEEAWRDPAGTTAMAEAARAEAQAYSAAAMREELVTLWRRVAGRPAVAPGSERPTVAAEVAPSSPEAGSSSTLH